MVKNKDRWSALSMSERADLIKLYVSNGITSLNDIKRDYNSFGDGGDTEGAGVENDIPTLDAYLQMKLQEARQMALANSYNAVEPRLAKKYYTEEDLNILQSALRYAEDGFNIYNKRAEETEKKLNHPLAPEHLFIFNPIYRNAYSDTGLNDYGEDLLGKLSVERYNATSHKNDAKEYQDRLNHINKYGYDWTGYGCITNATGWYGDPYICASNIEFKKDPSKYGFVEINADDALPGDIFQYDYGNSPHHATMYSKKGDDGKYYSNYHNGNYKEAIKHDVGYWGKGQRAFRFVGLPEDIEAWTQEYNEKYKNSKEGTNNHSNGGKINRFDIGGPTREMTPSEAAAINKTLNSSQYMLAVGDSPDDPAYLSTDLLEPAVVKAFNSEEDYNRYQGEKFGEYVSNEISEAGTKLAPVLVGAAATPWAISGGIAAYTNPITRSIIDLAGSIDGIRNAASKNGVRKTIRLAKEGDVWGTTKSAIGDIFDIAGGIGLAGDVYRYGKKASKSALLKNSGKIRDFAKGMSKNFKYALRSKQPIRFIWNDGNIIQNDFPKELLSEDAWYRIVGNGMRNKRFSDVYGAIADARNSGVVRTTESKSIFKSPMFKKGIPFWDIQDNKALIVSNPGSDLDWVAVNYRGELNPTVPLEKNNFVGTPLYKGEPNKAPSSMFTYWRKYPFIGWRNMPLHYEKGGFLNTFEEGGPADSKHVEDVVRTTRGATGRIFTRDFPWVDVMGAKHLWDSWRVMRGNNKKVAPSDDNYTGTAMKGVGVQTDDGLGFVSQQDLANVLGYTPKDFVDTYVYGVTPFEELGVFKKETSPERHVVRSKVKKVEDSGKQVNTYQTQRDTLDANTVAALDSLLNAGLVDLRSENTTYQKSPFNIGDSGIIYDGNNSTIATAYLPNGMPVSKAIDVFDTDPKEWNYKVGPLAKTGLSFIHDNTNPFLMTTPWYYPIKSTDFLSRLYYLFGIEADPEYNVISNKGDKNGVVWNLHEALEWLDSHPDLTEMPVKAKKD